jgi:hypothetical protein
MSKDPLNTLKQSLDQLLQADTSVKRKNKQIYDQRKELFINLINQFEVTITRSYLMEKDFKVNLAKYDESFYQIIDSLILLYFGKEIYEILSFYFYERYNPDGSKNTLTIEESGEEVDIKDAEDLFQVILNINPSLFNAKG